MPLDFSGYSEDQLLAIGLRLRALTEDPTHPQARAAQATLLQLHEYLEERVAIAEFVREIFENTWEALAS